MAYPIWVENQKRKGTNITHKNGHYYLYEANAIYSIALLRLLNKYPFKRISLGYSQSYISEVFGKTSLSAGSISALLKKIGYNRDKCVSFMKEFIQGSSYILFDGTNITSKSQQLDINKVGYNSHRKYDPQINLLYAFSTDKNSPVYYRILPGNIREVNSFAKSVEEAGIKNTVVIGDKGFGSNANFEMLEEKKLKYIIPLKRNNSLFEKEPLKVGNIDAFDGHFIYNNRAIFYYEYEKEDKTIVVYQDRELKMREEKDYMTRMESNMEEYTHENLLKKQYDFGTFVVATNVKETPQKVYELYKKRGEIETSFDFLKNLLEVDAVYIQDKYAMEGWGLINHISLMMVYKIYDLLREKKLLSKYSINDLLSHLKYIQKIKINNEWITSEINGKTKKLLKELELDIT